jgi:hypothetical protein
MADQGTTITERIDRKIDLGVMGELAISKGEARTPTFETMRDILEFAKVMAVSGVAVRKHLRNNSGACAAVCMQAARWNMDPFAVANKSYEVNDQLAYESQLITAVINTRAPILGRLRVSFVGEAGNRRCVASAIFVGDTEPTTVSSPPIGSIKPKNSPLWVSDPDQQLAYYTQRAWARRCCPEVLLGVYDPDEISEVGPDAARDVTPPRPTRAQFVEDRPIVEAEARQVEEWPFVDADGEELQIDSAAAWATIFLNCMSSPLLAASQREGVWEANSPTLARLRATGEAGEKAAATIHAAHDEALAGDDRARAAATTSSASSATDTQEKGASASSGEKKARSGAKVATELTYAERLAASSGLDILEAWRDKQSEQTQALLAPEWERLTRIAKATDAAHLGGGNG